MLVLERDMLSVSGTQWRAMKAVLAIAAVMVGYYCLFGNVLTDPTNAEEIVTGVSAPNAGEIVENQIGYLDIPSAQIRTRITEVGVDEKSAVGVPVDSAGWFNISARPGETGVSFLDGHTPGVFDGLDSLKPSETISLHLDAGRIINYVVQSVRKVELSGISMFELLTPPTDLANDSQFLVLMTCAGEFDENRDTYAQRVIVTAERVQN